MIPDNATFSVEQDVILPHHLFEAVTDSAEPFETLLRSRLHDILEEWEEAYLSSPSDRALIFECINQISDAMYPPEDSDD